MTFKLGITLTIKCSILGSRSTGLSLIVKCTNFSKAKTPSSPIAFSILLWCKYNIYNLVNFYSPIFWGIFDMLLWDKSSFSKLVHLCRNYNSSVMISLPDSTKIFSFYGATIFLLKKMSLWGWGFFFWMSKAPVVRIKLFKVYIIITYK